MDSCANCKFGTFPIPDTCMFCRVNDDMERPSKLERANYESILERTVTNIPVPVNPSDVFLFKRNGTGKLRKYS